MCITASVLVPGVVLPQPPEKLLLDHHSRPGVAVSRVGDELLSPVDVGKGCGLGLPCRDDRFTPRKCLRDNVSGGKLREEVRRHAFEVLCEFLGVLAPGTEEDHGADVAEDGAFDARVDLVEVLMCERERQTKLARFTEDRGEGARP